MLMLTSTSGAPPAGHFLLHVEVSVWMHEDSPFREGSGHFEM